jgi:hypothetical protein
MAAAPALTATAAAAAAAAAVTAINTPCRLLLLLQQYSANSYGWARHFGW